ncbi:MAG: hypothetical protein J2P37_00170 [Ktedonobacteraceae bacterium]|nr:hypothetical protein [Ktedonobacteraceae bacterium]
MSDSPKKKTLDQYTPEELRQIFTPEELQMELLTNAVQAHERPELGEGWKRYHRNVQRAVELFDE